MTKTLYRWFWVWDFEKEEQWFNEMAEQGWVLESVGFCRYTFRQCEPGEYTVRMEMHPYEPEYIEFMEETGAELVGRVFQWIYLRKKTSDGEFNIFSDIDSRIEHLQKIARVLMIIGFMNIAVGLLNAFNPTHVGFLNMLCAALLMYGLGRIHGKIESLENSRQIHE